MSRSAERRAATRGMPASARNAIAAAAIAIRAGGDLADPPQPGFERGSGEQQQRGDRPEGGPAERGPRAQAEQDQGDGRICDRHFAEQHDPVEPRVDHGALDANQQPHREQILDQREHDPVGLVRQPDLAGEEVELERPGGDGQQREPGRTDVVHPREHDAFGRRVRARHARGRTDSQLARKAIGRAERGIDQAQIAQRLHQERVGPKAPPQRVEADAADVGIAIGGELGGVIAASADELGFGRHHAHGEARRSGRLLLARVRQFPPVKVRDIEAAKRPQHPLSRCASGRRTARARGW